MVQALQQWQTSLADQPRSGRPQTVNNDALREMVKQQPQTSMAVVLGE